MALLNCPECNHEVSEYAEKCPNCGYPITDYVKQYKREQILTQIDFEKLPENIECPVCGVSRPKKVTYEAGMYCTICGSDLSDIDKLKEENEKHVEERMKQQERERIAKLPKCPTCGSTDLRKITASEKATSSVLFGLFGNKRKKQFHCNSCGYEW